MKIATKTWHYLADFVIVLEIRMLGEKLWSSASSFSLDLTSITSPFVCLKILYESKEKEKQTESIVSLHAY